jgi:lipid II:glycine glycyltransferase (peptidoglycan interpeptide bridge formation enzyme)
MSWDQVLETTKVIPADFFRVETAEGTAIAAALVFKVAADVVQVIYWGDLPDYSELKTMNFLSYKLFGFYKEKGIGVIDIGPSTEDSVPNHGLCEFKESIGCNIQPKYSLIYKFQ